MENKKRLRENLGNLRDKLRSIDSRSELGRVEIATVRKMMFGEISQGEFNSIVNNSSEANIQRLYIDRALGLAMASDAFIEGLNAEDPTSTPSQIALVADVVSNSTSSFTAGTSAAAISAYY